LESTEECFPEVDEETELITVRVDDWALTTWSNKKMSNSLEDWHKESVVQASSIAIDPAISRMLKDTGLLRVPSDNKPAEPLDLSAHSQHHW
jgi:hypothetical protein